jgi:hypothetical protein
MHGANPELQDVHMEDMDLQALLEIHPTCNIVLDEESSQSLKVPPKSKSWDVSPAIFCIPPVSRR